MLYSALAFFVVAMTTLALGLVGIVPGVAGLANITLLLSLGSLAAKAMELRDPEEQGPTSPDGPR